MKENFCKSILILLVLLTFTHSCTSDTQNGHTAHSDEFTEAPDFFVPYSIAEDGAAEFDRNRLYVRDYSSFLNAVSIIATGLHPDEFGNDNYRPDLYPEAMHQRAKQWLDMVDLIDTYFNDSGRISPRLEHMAGVYSVAGDVDLSIYPHLVYASHIHHQSGRFEQDEALRNRLNREPANYLVSPGRYLMNEHFREGAFHHADGSVDHKSMSYGLGGIHANAYAWVASKNTGEQEDRGVLTEADLAHYMEHTPDDMVRIYREAAGRLDGAWDASRSIYDFGDGTTWQLDAVGAMIRGNKALYDFLYMFGKEDDAETARRVFERTVAMLEAVAPLTRPWGMPDRVTFTEDGARAASQVVNVYDWYQFLNHLGGGYGLDREREGMPMYLTRYRKDIADLIGNLSDSALRGALAYHIDERDRIVTTVSYTNGSVTDDRFTTSTAGMFIVTAANMYRKGSDFEQASEWEEIPAPVANRSRELYDAIFSLFGHVERAM
ncbi:MAG: hypothetical protein R6U28_05040 [Cyclonatronaceae bacterium]